MKTIINYRGIEIEMEAIPMAEIGIAELLCDRCPYNDNCESFPDPRELSKVSESRGYNFVDFCEDIDMDDDLILSTEGLIENCQHIPVSGSLEKLLTIEKA